MRENNLSQLVGALGGWLEARPYGAQQDALDRAARIVLDMQLLGIGIDDVDAPELAALDPEDRAVVEQARVWALARREDASRRERTRERAALHRRAVERERDPSDAFARPASEPEPTREPQDVAAGQPVDLHAELAFGRGLVETPPPSTVDPPATTELAAPDVHDFFSVLATDADAWAARLRRTSPDVVFNVVIVVWAIAALGALAVLARVVLG